MGHRRWLAGLLLFVLLITALHILSAYPLWVESYYTQGFYYHLCNLFNAVTGLFPFSLFEIVVAVVVLLVLILTVQWLILFLRKRATFFVALGSLFLRVSAIGAGLYCWFLVCWGLNYYRVPLLEKQGFAGIHADEEQCITASRWATEEIARLIGDPRFEDLDAALHAALEGLDRVLSDMGEKAPAPTIRLKHYLWNYPLDATRTYGMISPFTLELFLSRSLFPQEIPFLAAHEAAHIKGFASETEANFLAFEACLASGHPLAQFIAFLAVLPYLYPAVPREERIALLGIWPDRVKEIVRAIQERDQRHEGTLLEALHTVYDIYLKFHSVEGGIKSYSRVGGWIAVIHYDEARAALEEKDHDRPPPKKE